MLSTKTERQEVVGFGLWMDKEVTLNPSILHEWIARAMPDKPNAQDSDLENTYAQEWALWSRKIIS